MLATTPCVFAVVPFEVRRPASAPVVTTAANAASAPSNASNRMCMSPSGSLAGGASKPNRRTGLRPRRGATVADLAAFPCHKLRARTAADPILRDAKVCLLQALLVQLAHGTY